MNSNFPENGKLVKFNLSPLGEGVITGVFHQGKIFHLYRARINGCQDAVLKTPSPVPSNDGLFTRQFVETSESFYSTVAGIQFLEETGQRLDQIKVASWMLMVEAQTIHSTRGAWNHEVRALGVWDGISNLRTAKALGDFNFTDRIDLRFLLVMVMPYYEATPFSALPPALKKYLFPNMLPALWDALCAAPHGDLSESNILIDQTKNIFHLIDPGVTLKSEAYSSDGRPFVSIFSTTPINYPLISPDNHNPPAGAGLKNHLFGSQIDDPDKTISDERRPSGADLLALGIIYHRILTGREIILGNGLLVEKPAWLNSWGRQQQNAGFTVHKRIYDALSANYMQNELDKADLGHNEKRLVHSLLNLEVPSKQELLELIEFARK